LRDRALISVMTFAFARIGAVVAMRVENYYPKGKRWWVRLHEKGGKRMSDIPPRADTLLGGRLPAVRSRPAARPPREGLP
jgi:hypothetical protein